MDKRPNVVFITSHDTGRHLGCYGVPSVHTPNLDALAAEGVRFANCFATSALCSPSRGAAMTGRYPQRNGMLGLCHGAFGWALNDGERHVSHLLHDAGYYTALLGHQHETVDIDKQLCFDHHDLHRYPNTWEHVHGPDVAQGVRRFLTGEAASRSPFYLQVGFFETHLPFDFGGIQSDDSKGVWVPPYLQDTEEARRELAQFQGNVRTMDAAVGVILDALREAGLDENTIVIYTVDHGLDFPRAKRTLYDTGTAIALIMRWPAGGIAEGRVCDGLVSNVDLVPTLLELLGIDAPDNLDGLSFAPAALSKGASPRHYAYAMMSGHGTGKEIRAVRSGTHKLIRNFEIRHEAVPPVYFGDTDKHKGRNRRCAVPLVELYDLQKDPNEFENVAEDPHYAEVRRTLEERLWHWLEELDDPILRGPVPTPHYLKAQGAYKEWKATEST